MTVGSCPYGFVCLCGWVYGWYMKCWQVVYVLALNINLLQHR